MSDRYEELLWEEVRTEHIEQNEWIDIRRSAFRMPDGVIAEPFYTYSRRDYVVVVAADTEGRYLCVRQFRQGIRRVTVEFPAGGLERTDGKEYRIGAEEPGAESTLEAAKRELREETGYVSDEWTHLITLPSNATIADNYASVFLAENCRRVTGQELDQYEFLHVERYTGEEIDALIRSGDFPQSVHVMAWLLAKRREAPPASSGPSRAVPDYRLIARQAEAFAEAEADAVPLLANVSALLFETLERINWAGFYLMNRGSLMLGPFQGRPACIRIDVGRGVCGTAVREDRPVRVDDVHAFPGHIACDSASCSEIVIPLHSGGRVVGVLDIDSPEPARFTAEDEEGLRHLAEVLERAADFSRLDPASAGST